MKDDIDYEDFELSEEDESDVDPDEPLKSKKSCKEMTFDDFIDNSLFHGCFQF
jgi:hypothetical protein